MDVVERVKASKISGDKCLDFYADWAETYDKVTQDIFFIITMTS